ncbi:hypothetical protein A343_0158, partial [Porphyromonas gingivalis JCVI SC001]
MASSLPRTCFVSLCFIVLMFAVSLTAGGQTLPDSLIIIKRIWQNRMADEIIYRMDTFRIIRQERYYRLYDKRISAKHIRNLVTEIRKADNKYNNLSKYGIDTSRIRNGVFMLKAYVKDRKASGWNDLQKEVIAKELSTPENYHEALNNFMRYSESYSMHVGYRSDLVVKTFAAGKVEDELFSRKSRDSFKMLWTNQRGDTVYNYQIEKGIDRFVGPKKRRKPLMGEPLLKYLVEKIVESNSNILYRLAADSYKKEIDELKTDFELESAEEMYGRGRYIWNEPRTMKIVLRNDLMLPNVRMVFLAAATGSTIYSRDSVRGDLKYFLIR